MSSGGEDAGRWALELVRDLLPVHRSLTGDGVRATLRALGEVIPLELTEVPTGTPLYGWHVPREWNLRAAWIEDASGRRVVDLADSPLHVVGYSVPVDVELSGAELESHLNSLPAHPDRIPYRTEYWSETWGFCLAHAVRATIRPDASYRVHIDATLADGSLTYAECVLPGNEPEEVLLSTYVCHPGLANDNLSGVALLAVLGARLAERERRFSYRLLFGPGTLGPLAWLSRNEDRLERVMAGLCVSCVGDPGPIRYKLSRGGAARIDRVAARVVASEPDGIVEDFVPWGGDERQLCSPGFDLPVGALTRTPHGLFPEYHSSADDLELVRPEHLADSLRVIEAILARLERERPLVGVETRGEPRLAPLGLYRAIEEGDRSADGMRQRALLWSLSLADGAHSPDDVAQRSGIPLPVIEDAVQLLTAKGLLR